MFNRIVTAINNTVNNGTKGVFEIKNEIIDINEAINDLFEAINNINVNITGGGCLNDVIIAINNTVNNGEKGVFEIKNEIIELNQTIQIINNNTQSAFTGTLTTGPIFLPTVGTTDILTKILNNNANNHTVNITLFNLMNCPKEIFASNSLTLPACCANEIIISDVPTNYEVQISGVVPGIYVFTTASQGGSDNVITATLKHSQFSLEVGNSTCV